MASGEPEAAFGDLETLSENSPRSGESTSLNLGTISESPSPLALRPLADIQLDKDEQLHEDAQQSQLALSPTVPIFLHVCKEKW